MPHHPKNNGRLYKFLLKIRSSFSLGSSFPSLITEVFVCNVHSQKLLVQENMSLVPFDSQPVLASQLLTQICSFWKEWLSQGHRLGCVRLSQGLSLALKATWLPVGPWGGSFVLGSRGAVNVCLHTSAYAASVWISTVFKWAGSLFDQNSCDFSFFFCCHLYRHFSLLWNFVLVCKFSGDKQAQKLLEQGCVEPEKKTRTCSFETLNLSW